MKIKVKLLDQYIWQQLIFVFIGSLGFLAGLGVTVGTVSDLTYKISEYNLPLTVAVQIFFFKIPEYTAYALPIALLLTTLLVYGRLNLNLELVAFFSSGINVFSIVKPAILLSFLITGTTFLLNEFLVAPANYKVVELENIFIPETKSYLHKKDLFFPEYKTFSKNQSRLIRLYYAKHFDGDSFQDITIIDWKNSYIEKIIFAEQAIWNQEQKKWIFFNGRIKNFEPIKSNMGLSNSINSNLARVDFFQKKSLLMPTTFFEIANKKSDPQNMSLSEASKYLKLIIKSENQPQIRLFRVRIQQKLAFPFICIVFAVIGSSISINFAQVNRGKGFTICVGIVFSYYLLGFIIGSCGMVGLVSPLVAGWLPNFLGGGIGGILLYRNNY